MAYYVDDAAQPAKALEVARRELERRQDILTLDGYAWALAATGDYTEANAQMKKVLALGTKDAKIREHARVIAEHAQLQAAALTPRDR